VLVNVLSINLAATATLWYSGYRPDHWLRLDEARSATIKRAAILLASIAVLSVFLGGVTYMSYTTAAIEDDMIAGVEDTVQENPELRLVDVNLVHEENLYERVFDPRPERVVVTVARPPGETYPGLPDRLRRNVVNGNDVVVEVRYMDYETAGNRDGTLENLEETPSPAGARQFFSVAHLS
jgi:hypothetical protein